MCMLNLYNFVYFFKKLCMLNVQYFVYLLKNYVHWIYKLVYNLWKIVYINKKNWVYSLKNVNIEWTKLLTFFENFCTLYIHNFVQLLKNCVRWMYRIVYNH